MNTYTICELFINETGINSLTTIAAKVNGGYKVVTHDGRTIYTATPLGGGKYEIAYTGMAAIVILAQHDIIATEHTKAWAKHAVGHHKLVNVYNLPTW